MWFDKWNETFTSQKRRFVRKQWTTGTSRYKSIWSGLSNTGWNWNQYNHSWSSFAGRVSSYFICTIKYNDIPCLIRDWNLRTNWFKTYRKQQTSTNLGQKARNQHNFWRFWIIRNWRNPNEYENTTRSCRFQNWGETLRWLKSLRWPQWWNQETIFENNVSESRKTRIKR